MADTISESNKPFSVEFHQSENVTAPVEGVMTSSNAIEDTQPDPNAAPSTIDELVKDTILRDVKAVGLKFYRVFLPKSSRTLLRDWDLWGPLILCTSLALLLQSHSTEVDGRGGPQFAQVFIIYWVGAALVTLNAQLLSRKDSSVGSASAPGFLQSVCVLGYCVLPLLVALIACRLAALFASGSNIGLIVLRWASIGVGMVWSIFAASTAFLPDRLPPQQEQQQQQQQQKQQLFSDRKILVAYPICLFYTVLAWLVLAGSAA